MLSPAMRIVFQISLSFSGLEVLEAVTTNGSVFAYVCSVLKSGESSLFFSCPTLLPCRWRRHIPPKRRFTSFGLRGVKIPEDRLSEIVINFLEGENIRHAHGNKMNSILCVPFVLGCVLV